ncbi:MAG: 2-dehydropantoate 2-reductase N-terminal domain-containing protein [Sporichthyaceae bacterium]
MRAVVVGPGRIGCGFAGHLLHRSGFEVSFVGRRPTIDRLRTAGRYVVRLTDGHTWQEETVPCHKAVGLKKEAATGKLIGKADVVCVAVGVEALAAIAPVLARGLARNPRPVNVIACENAEDAGDRLRAAVAALLGEAETARHGFSGAVVGRVVAHRLHGPDLHTPIELVGEPSGEFVVDANALRDPLPNVEGMHARTDFVAAFRSKLYGYSAGHATAAYLGHLKGYRYLHAAIRDPEVAAGTLAAMREGQDALRAAYGPSFAGTEADLDAIMARFGNAALADTVARIGRDTRRKLAPTDRLVGAARVLEGTGAPAHALATAAAAALCFGCAEHPPLARPCPGDVPQATLERVGALLAAVCQLPAGDDLARRIQDQWSALAGGGEDGNLLLSLQDPVWSWTSGSWARAS